MIIKIRKEKMKPLWIPSNKRIQSSNLFRFYDKLQDDWNIAFEKYEDLWLWSVTEKEKFWTSLWDFTGVIGDKGEIIIEKTEKMYNTKFFPDACLNFSENLLRRNDDADSVVFWGEDVVKKRISWKELQIIVGKVASGLKKQGIKKGDRVAAYMPNMIETVVGLLATASIGAVWSSCSPDFGPKGVIDRFVQIKPRILISSDKYFYNNNKVFKIIDRIPEILDSVPSIENVFIVPYDSTSLDIPSDKIIKPWDDLLDHSFSGEILFEQTRFNDPLCILFSSGTTGSPKCIVHSVGGTLLQHLKEHQLHCDIKADDKVFYFTTCGWMMWNWLVTSLASKATLMLYDGFPFYPDNNVLFDYIDREKITFFGTGAKFIDAIKKKTLSPKNSHSLKSLKTITSTGSPLSQESFQYVYDNIKTNLHLASISGGTDIISCFVLGNPTEPVWSGEIQCRGLGLDVDVFNDDGKSVLGAKGELVCKSPFPALPIGFWNDNLKEKYKETYYKKFPNVWYHGDYAELTTNNGIIIYGRSDATLNPGGVRIGTAEIYREVEKLDVVLESIAVGKDIQEDIEIILFVVLQEGKILNKKLEEIIRDKIKNNVSPRHVPKKIFQVNEIPRTKSGKIVELAVRDVIHGREIKNIEAIANPDSLQYFSNLDIY